MEDFNSSDFKTIFLKLLEEAAEDRAALRELMKVQGDRIAEQGDRIAEQGDRIAEQGDRIAEQGDRIAEQGDRIAEQGDRIAEQGDRIAELNEQAEEDRAIMKAQGDRITELNEQAEEDRALMRAQIAAQNKSIKEALRQLGNMKQNYGALVESFIGEGMVKLMDFPDQGVFQKVIHNFPFKFKESASDLDTFFLFSKAVVVVDAKATYSGKDFEKWQTELLPSLLADKDFQHLVRGRPVYVGLASLRFKRGMVEEASAAGYYAFKLLNDNARLMNGPGFKVRAVG